MSYDLVDIFDVAIVAAIEGLALDPAASLRYDLVDIFDVAIADPLLALAIDEGAMSYDLVDMFDMPCQRSSYRATNCDLFTSR